MTSGDEVDVAADNVESLRKIVTLPCKIVNQANPLTSAALVFEIAASKKEGQADDFGEAADDL